MTEENKPEEKKPVDAESKEAAVEASENQTDEAKAGFLSNIMSLAKKYKLYIAIGGGVAAIAVVAFILFMGGESDPVVTEESEVASHQSSEEIAAHSTQSEETVNEPEHHSIEPGAGSNHGDNNDSHAEISHNTEKPKRAEPTLEEAIYEWTPEELMELARLKSAPKATVERDSLAMSLFDTAAIMADLESMFALPDVDEDIINMTPKDSIDTLNWIEAEQAKINSDRADLVKQRKELEKLNNYANKALNRIEQIESERIINLARLYDKMKPHEVAKLFANLSDSVVIQIIPRMKPSNASKILTLMPTRRAANISKQLVTVMGNK